MNKKRTDEINYVWDNFSFYGGDPKLKRIHANTNELSSVPTLANMALCYDFEATRATDRSFHVLYYRSKRYITDDGKTVQEILKRYDVSGKEEVIDLIRRTYREREICMINDQICLHLSSPSDTIADGRAKLKSMIDRLLFICDKILQKRQNEG